MEDERARRARGAVGCDRGVASGKPIDRDGVRASKVIEARVGGILGDTPAMILFKLAELSDLGTALTLLPLYYEYDGQSYDAALAEQGLRQLIADKNLGEFLIIFSKDRPIGYFAITFGFSLECRGQGIGAKAIEHAIQRCIANQVQVLRLEVINENSGALKFYKKLGFEDLGRHLLMRHIAGATELESPTRVAKIRR